MCTYVHMYMSYVPYVSVTTRAVPICTVSNIRKCGNFWIHSRVMPTQAIHHTGLQIRAFIAFLYRIILELMPLRLIPRLKSSSWKLAVRRPPPISTDYIQNFLPEYRGFDQWIANTRENTAMILSEESLGGSPVRVYRPRAR